MLEFIDGRALCSCELFKPRSQRSSQLCAEFIQERPHWVWIVKQLAAIADRLYSRTHPCIDRQAISVVSKPLEFIPCSLTLGALVISGLPAFKKLSQFLVSIGHLAELPVATEGLQSVDLLCARWGRKWWLPSRSGCKVLKMLEQRGNSRTFGIDFVRDPGIGEKLFHLQTLLNRRRRILFVESGLADLGREKLLRPGKRLPFLLRPNVPSG